MRVGKMSMTKQWPRAGVEAGGMIWRRAQDGEKKKKKIMDGVASGAGARMWSGRTRTHGLKVGKMDGGSGRVRAKKTRLGDPPNLTKRSKLGLLTPLPSHILSFFVAWCLSGMFGCQLRLRPGMWSKDCSLGRPCFGVKSLWHDLVCRIRLRDGIDRRSLPKHGLQSSSNSLTVVSLQTHLSLHFFPFQTVSKDL